MRSIHRSDRGSSLLALSAASLIVAACSSSGAEPAPLRAHRPHRRRPASPAGGAAGGAADVAVGTGAVGALLTGEDGKTLYVFTPDTANNSACTDAVRDELAAVHRRRPERRPRPAAA